jgi:hypothetical protein
VLVSSSCAPARLHENHAVPLVVHHHDQVLALLHQAGAEGAEVERDLRRLLPLKTKAEYEPDDIAASVAAKAVQRAQCCAAVAGRVASTTR